MLQVVFDTNAYRRLVQSKPIEDVRKHFQAITGAEERKEFQIFMSPIPWIELFCHLADGLDRAFETCMKAVVGSFIHSRIDPRFDGPKLMPQFLMVVADALFGHRDQGEERVVRGLDSMAARINALPTRETTSEKENNKYLRNIVSFSDLTEKEFMDTFTQFQTNYHSLAGSSKNEIRALAGTDDFFYTWIDIILFQAAQLSRVDVTSLSQVDLNSKREILMNYFMAPCYLAKRILGELIANSTFDIEKGSRRNWCWDYQMLFYISTNNFLMMVTEDGPMREAAKASGVGDRIIDLKKYLEMLDLKIPYK